jgi:hypothetical protein
MGTRKPVALALTILAYVLTTFGVQGASHFAINANHYAAVSFMRSEPVIPMGIAAMLIQGLLFGVLFDAYRRGPVRVWDGVLFSWAIGAFLTSYVVLGEAGKYAVPSISSWVGVETSVAFVQFTVFGALLGLIHRGGLPVESGAGTRKAQMQSRRA